MEQNHCQSCNSYTGQERRQAECPVHMDFVAQVSKMTTAMEWFQGLGKWAVGLITLIIFAAVGAHLTLAVKVEQIAGQVDKTITLLDKHITKENHNGG